MLCSNFALWHDDACKKELAEYGQKLTTYNLFLLNVQIATKLASAFRNIKDNLRLGKYSL